MERESKRRQPGRFLACQTGSRRSMHRWVTVMVLLLWDRLLLYMIVLCLIEPVYGAAFVGAVSMYLGYQL